MIRINLLQGRRLGTTRRFRGWRVLAIFIFSGIVFILGTLQVELLNRLEKSADRLRSRKSQVTRYRQMDKEIRRLGTKLSGLQQKIYLIQTLERQRSLPARLLTAMAEVIIPQKLGFEQIAYGDNTVTIKGIALDDSAVLGFINRLRLRPFFTEVTLRAIEEKALADRGRVQAFEIRCRVHPTKTAPVMADDRTSGQ